MVRTLAYFAAIPLMGLYPKKPKPLIQKHTCTPMFIAALHTIAKVWKQPKCPKNGWTDKEDVVYTYKWNTTQPHKRIKYCHLQQHGWMGGHYAKWNKPDKERQILYDVIYMWNL